MGNESRTMNVPGKIRITGRMMIRMTTPPTEPMAQPLPDTSATSSGPAISGNRLS